MARGFSEPMKGNRQSLLDLHLSEEEHIKPKEIKRRVNAKKRYDRSVTRLYELTSYIEFTKEKK